MEEKERQKKKLEYKWIVVALCFLMVLICLGFCSSTNSLFVKPVTEALEIERSAYSVKDSIRYVATAIVNIFFGSLVAKFGSKKLIAAGFISLIGSMVLYAVATNVWVLYAGGFFLGVGFAWTTTTMVGYVVNQWCKESKGTIMGAILAANGIGGAIATQIITPVINGTGEMPGYRKAYFLIATVLAVVAALVIIFFKEKPKSVDNVTPTPSKKKARGQSWVGIEFSATVKKAYFYGALVCLFLTGVVLQGVTSVAAAHMGDVGLNMSFVATVLSVHSIALAVFKFATGFIYDKCGLRFTVTMCSLTAIVVMILLACVSNSPTGMVLAMIYGVLASLALPLETILLPIYASDLFGDKSFNKVLGIFVSVNTAGYALGGPMLNLCFDLMGSYKPAFFVFAGIMGVVVIGLQFVISFANKERKKVLLSIEEKAVSEQ